MWDESRARGPRKPCRLCLREPRSPASCPSRRIARREWRGPANRRQLRALFNSQQAVTLTVKPGKAPSTGNSSRFAARRDEEPPGPHPVRLQGSPADVLQCLACRPERGRWHRSPGGQPALVHPQEPTPVNATVTQDDAVDWVDGRGAISLVSQLSRNIIRWPAISGQRCPAAARLARLPWSGRLSSG
jgi:hypothetical protein